MCLGVQNDQDGSRQQSVKKEGGDGVQVQSQKGDRRALRRCGLGFGIWSRSLGSSVKGHYVEK